MHSKEFSEYLNPIALEQFDSFIKLHPADSIDQLLLLCGECYRENEEKYI